MADDDDPPAGWDQGECRMWEAYRRGEWCEGVPEVRGEAVRQLLLTAPPPRSGYLARLRLRGVRIRGELDLSEAAVGGAVRLQRCRLDQAPRLDGAQVEALELDECRLPGLRAHSARTAREFKVTRCTANGTLDLRSLTVGTHLFLDGTKVRAGPGEAAIDARSVAVDESLSATGLDCAGTFYLTNARVQDLLILRGATISTARGNLQMSELTVGGGLYMGRGFSCAGTVNLCGASIGASLELLDATLTGPGLDAGDYALHLGCAQVGGDIQAERGLVVDGPITLADTSIRGSIVLKGARLNHPAGTALTAARAHVGGDLDCRDGLSAHGTLDLCDARIGGSLLLDGAELTAPGGDSDALSANGIDIGGVARLGRGLTAHGRIGISNATVRSYVSFHGAILDAAGAQEALVCRGTTAAQLSLQFAESPKGHVSLSRTKVMLIRDIPANWPTSLRLDGTVYDMLRPTLPATERLPWLMRDQEGFKPQPYEQLAGVYRRHGRDADARTVLLAKQRNLRPTLAFPARLWSLLQDAAVGYGYRPLRAVWLLVCLLAAGSALFASWHPEPVGGSPYPRFQPVIYTLDLLLPLVDLGQERAYEPSGAMQWAGIVLIGTGWLLATTVAAGAGRVLRRT